MLKREDIRIRDPFILVDEQSKTYYMYGTTSFFSSDTLVAEDNFLVYVSKDLENFEGPYVIFDGKKNNFWATQDFWAAEVHKYGGKYYLFGSFKADNRKRATQILVSDSPLGEFIPLSEKTATPPDQQCLDGTLWVENGTPYLIYCHEWVETYDGEMCAVELSKDLSNRVGEPFVLFKASENPFVTALSILDGKDCYVTDGPFLFEENGKLNMIWSSFINGKYAILHSQANSLLDKWTHLTPWNSENGGHAMVFTDLKGEKYVSFHQPNDASYERAVFIPFEKK